MTWLFEDHIADIEELQPLIDNLGLIVELGYTCEEDHYMEIKRDGIVLWGTNDATDLNPFLNGLKTAQAFIIG